MLTKILFTALVVAVVYALYRFRARTGQTQGKRAGSPPKQGQLMRGPRGGSRIGRIAAYSLVGLIVLISAGFYYLHWQEQHRIVMIRVIDGRSGNATTYRAYKKSIDGSRFESLDGKTVILGEAERVEMVEDR
jgi:hypothetical protein